MRAHLSGFSGLPPLAVLELTYRCNHACLFCSCPWEADAAYRGEELSAADWERAVDNLMAGGTWAFTLTGGEPLMREDLKEIAEMIQSKGAPVNLISNGRKIDEAFLDYLGEKISISTSACPVFGPFPRIRGWTTSGMCCRCSKKRRNAATPLPRTSPSRKRIYRSCMRTSLTRCFWERITCCSTGSCPAAED